MSRHQIGEPLHSNKGLKVGTDKMYLRILQDGCPINGCNTNEPSTYGSPTKDSPINESLTNGYPSDLNETKVAEASFRLPLLLSLIGVIIVVVLITLSYRCYIRKSRPKVNTGCLDTFFLF